MVSLGQSLREEREARDISLEEIASATKIVGRYLEALETDRLDLMPGGFFIKGIIRSYARAIGLDPEEVLERYKAAGLVAAPEPAKGIFAKRVAPAPVPTDKAQVAAPSTPGEIPPPAAEDPAGAKKPEPALVFEEAPAKLERLLIAARRLTRHWRVLAAVGVIGVALLLWSPWRQHPAAGRSGSATTPSLRPASKPAETTPSVPSGPPRSSEKTAAGPGQQAAPTVSQPGAEAAVPPVAEPPAPKPETTAPAPATEEAWKGITIEIVFEAETWIQVYTDGALRIGGTFPPGASARAQANEKLLIHTGNAGGFTFKLNGRPAKPLGRSGQVLTDIKITPGNLKDFLEAPSPGRPTG
jgi:cytoskeletal protein RodZ